MNQTITRTIEDDVRDVIRETLPSDEFVRRLLREFVVLLPRSISDRGEHELVVLAGAGDEGMFLPVFTSEKLFRRTPLADAHAPARVPFDALMRQIRPDTGLAVNPMTEPTVSIRWFVLQNVVPDFGSDVIKQEATDEWLEALNRDFTTAEVPHAGRAHEALRRWSDLNGVAISLASLRANKIRDWFRSNIKPGSDWIGPIAEAAFYNDATFWRVNVPLCYGSPTVNPLDSLDMPASVKLRFCQDRNSVFVYLKLFADLYDYYYTVEDVCGRFSSDPLLEGFIEAARQHLTISAALLLETRPNPKAAESARTALEIFLKIFLRMKGLTEQELRNLRHDLSKLLAKCMQLDPTSSLKSLETKLAIFPDISARYRVEAISQRELWDSYYFALAAGVTVMRPMSNRDTAATIGVPPGF